MKLISLKLMNQLTMNLLWLALLLFSLVGLSSGQLGMFTFSLKDYDRYACRVMVGHILSHLSLSVIVKHRWVEISQK